MIAHAAYPRALFYSRFINTGSITERYEQFCTHSIQMAIEQVQYILWVVHEMIKSVFFTYTLNRIRTRYSIDDLMRNGLRIVFLLSLLDFDRSIIAEHLLVAQLHLAPMQ